MCKVTYAVKAEVAVIRNDGIEVVLGDHKKLCVVPAVAEAPPLILVDGDRDYVLSKTKTLRKGLFRTLGRITVSASQTKALTLPPPDLSTAIQPTVMATLNLQFYPNGALSEPPSLEGVTTKINASTFLAIRPVNMLPSLSSHVYQYDSSRRVYSNSVPLPFWCADSVAWTKHEPYPALMKRNSDSALSYHGSSGVLITETKADVLYYTAKVLVPITLPASKSWVPTFHSCIISRIYSLDLSLMVHTRGADVPAPSLSLHLPIQIASAGHPICRAQFTPAEAADWPSSANDCLVPRVTEGPGERPIGNSVLRPASCVPGTPPTELPPSYHELCHTSGFPSVWRMNIL
jgi:hypothetical protein